VERRGEHKSYFYFQSDYSHRRLEFKQLRNNINRSVVLLEYPQIIGKSNIQILADISSGINYLFVRILRAALLSDRQTARVLIFTKNAQMPCFTADSRNFYEYYYTAKS